MMSAPARARWLLGGVGAHTSSQISMPKVTPSIVRKSCGKEVMETEWPA